MTDRRTSPSYVEHFQIGGYLHSIEHTTGGYKVWRGGWPVAVYATVNDARSAIAWLAEQRLLEVTAMLKDALDEAHNDLARFRKGKLAAFKVVAEPAKAARRPRRGAK